MSLHDHGRINGRLRSVADPVGFLVNLFTHAPVGFAVWSADGRPLLTNNAFLDIFLVEPPPDYNVLKDDVLAENGMLAPFFQAFKGETVHVPTFWYDPRDLTSIKVEEGRRVAISMTIFPLFKDSGEVEYVAATYKDETEIMLAAERIKEREEDLRITLDSIGDAVMATDAVGRVTRMNPVAEQLSGWSLEQARGKHLNEVFLIHNETTRETVESPVERVLREGNIVGLANHTVLVSRDGTERAIADSAAPIRADDGHLRGVVLVFRDQTEEQNARRAVEQGAARLRLLVESSREFSIATASYGHLLNVIARRLGVMLGDLCAIRLLSKDGQRLEPNSAIYHPDPEMLEVARQVVIPQRLGEGISGGVAATGIPVCIRAITPAQLVAQTPPKFQALVARLAITSLLVVPLKSRDRILGVISMTRSHPASPYTEDDFLLAQDLADRASLAIENALLVNDLEERVAQRTAAIDEARLELEAFSYSVAHDLRSPLRAISGFSSALLEDHGESLNEGGRATIQRIVGGASRMGQIIDGLLALARVTRSEVAPETVDLTAAAHAMMDHLRATEAGRVVELVATEGVMANGDPRLLRVVLENLLGNAWKFTRGKPEPRIEFGSTEGGTAYFVRDNGAGFKMELADRLFTPFQRLHSAAQFEGTGIGLATVHRIIRRHGGRIWAEAEEGVGATFYFTLAAPPGRP